MEKDTQTQVNDNNTSPEKNATKKQSVKKKLMTAVFKDWNETFNNLTYMYIGDKESFRIWGEKKIHTDLTTFDNWDNLERFAGSTLTLTPKSTCVGSDFYIIYMPRFDKNDYNDYVTLSHEVSHVAFFALSFRGWRNYHDEDVQHSYQYFKDAIYTYFLDSVYSTMKKNKVSLIGTPMKVIHINKK